MAFSRLVDRKVAEAPTGSSATRPVADDAPSMLICRVAGRSLAVDIESVGEVIRAAETVRVGGPDDTTLGFLNVRGEHVPAIDTAVALGLPARQIQPSDRFVILDVPFGRVAILVEEVASIAEVVALHRGNEPDGARRDSSFTVPGRLAGGENLMVAIVDPERVGRLARAR